MLQNSLTYSLLKPNDFQVLAIANFRLCPETRIINYKKIPLLVVRVYMNTRLLLKEDVLNKILIC